ncbi:MAG: PAS domain S-box protein, partial [bacterium]|nr:PAS domain S-box protein [bacterium]
VARDISERQKAEAEINAQNTFLKNVIDSLKHPFFVIDADDHSIKMSNFSAKLTQNKTCFEFLHHYDQPCHHYGEACPLKEIKKTKKPVIMEHLHFEKNDIQKWVELHGYPIFDENGNITQIIEYCLDITERKKTVNLLKESEKRFRNLVEMLPYGIEEADTTGTITISNRAHHKILGYEDGELHGKKVWDFSVSPEEKIKNKNNFITQVKDQPERSSILRKNVRKDGKIIDIRVDWDYKRDSNGELTGFVSVISDISARKKAIDEAIFLAEILRQSTDSIVLTDMNGDITYVNPMFEKLTGYTSAETVGQNPRILKSESAPYPPEYYKVMWETLKKGDIWKGDFTNKKKNGEIFIEEASIFPFRDPESGEITGYGAVKKDITLRRKLEVQLKKSYNQVLYLKDKAEDANRLKSQFLANMSHDIRTPLNAVMGFTDLLSKDERRKKSRDYLNKIKTSSEGLLNLINDILDFSKIEAGQLDIYNRTFRLQVL